MFGLLNSRLLLQILRRVSNENLTVNLNYVQHSSVSFWEMSLMSLYYSKHNISNSPLGGYITDEWKILGS